jgi:Xaa-Pro aminopeptidase
MDIDGIQKYLTEHELDGWLLSDFHARNTVAVELLGLYGTVTRRSFYFIPAMGQPTGLVHNIEKTKFEGLPGNIITYSGYRALEDELKKLIGDYSKLAMEYSPMGRLPYIGLVDCGTIELIRWMGPEVVSSADLVAKFQACLSVEQIATHRMAAGNLKEIKDAAFDFIAASLTNGKKIKEFDVVTFIRDQFDKYEMETDDGPICAINGNAGNPHYEPSADNSAEIKKGQLVLIDLWAKVKTPRAAFADITHMAFAGTAAEIPEKYRELFGVLVSARDEAVRFVREHIEGRPVYGYEVDNACRRVIEKAGYGEYFVHRTGHSITTSTHGSGPNIDDLETEDRRRLQKGHLFSVEPGIYMKDCGFRTEIDVLIGHNGAEVTTVPLQNDIRPLFS